MVGLDEGALICDFAEVYHVYDWRRLPASTAATLAMGLGPDSRIMRKISGTPVPMDTLLLAMITDCVRILAWRQSGTRLFPGFETIDLGASVPVAGRRERALTARTISALGATP